MSENECKSNVKYKGNNMTLTQILNSKKKVAKKLEMVAEVVAKARKKYGNTDEEITSPEVNTTEGMTDLAYLTDADKVVMASKEINSIRVKAIESTKVTEGTVLDREIERLLAINPVLANLDSTSGSEYV